MRSTTLLSLFSGSGGFELAAFMCGITPTACSEIEPYPIAVTRARFPFMKHLGDISKINGAGIEPADVVTFGSPCQDLSVAGRRAGLKHEANGDEETTRSGLFMEAVRIIKEMRDATGGEYPRIALWENVLGAFSSNKGEDFRVVLEELIKIVEPGAVMPAVPKKGWAYADHYSGDGWSLAYRVLDAQFWGVPQRRRRIYLVLDLGGGRAGEILFKRKGLRGHFEKGRTPWKRTAGDAEGGAGIHNSEGNGFVKVYESHPVDSRIRELDMISPTVTAKFVKGGMDTPFVCKLNSYPIENHPADSRVSIDESGKIQTLTSRMGTGGGNVPMIMEERLVYCLQGNGIDRADTAGCNGRGWTENVCYTLNTIDRPAVVMTLQGDQVAGTLKARDYKGVGRHDSLGSAVCICFDKEVYNSGENGTGGHYIAEEGPAPTLRAGVPPGVNMEYVVRRLTPTECARLQGFPDRWGDIEPKEDFTEEEYQFWLDVRNTHAEINGKQVRDYTKKQMLTWYNRLHTDSAEYKLWGNGIALPTALYCMQGIAEALRQ